jgi:hypothetical protein
MTRTKEPAGGHSEWVRAWSLGAGLEELTLRRLSRTGARTAARTALGCDLSRCERCDSEEGHGGCRPQGTQAVLWSSYHWKEPFSASGFPVDGCESN